MNIIIKKKISKIFEHNFDDGPFELFNKNNLRIYHEIQDGYWSIFKYDENNDLI